MTLSVLQWRVPLSMLVIAVGTSLFAFENFPMAAIGAVLMLVGYVQMMLYQGPREEIRIGVDGMQSKGGFIAWKDVASIELEDNGVVLQLESGFRSRVYRPADAKAFLEQAHSFMDAEAPPESASGYREDVAPPAVLVRVVQDTRLSRDERVEAFHKLDEQEQQRVARTIAENEMRCAFSIADD